MPLQAYPGPQVSAPDCESGCASQAAPFAILPLVLIVNGPWPVSGDVEIGRLSCSDPVITGLAVINNEGFKSMDATLTQVPGGTTATVAVYGLDESGAVVCVIENDSVLNGELTVNCPASAVTWVARIEN